ncbi:hypothetical protein EMCRGX_G007880 [Ephydatia muelleri]
MKRNNLKQVIHCEVCLRLQLGTTSKNLKNIMSTKVGIQKIYDELAIYGITRYNISIFTEGTMRVAPNRKSELADQPIDRINSLFDELYSYRVKQVFECYYGRPNWVIDEEEENLIYEDDELDEETEELIFKDAADIAYLAEVNAVNVKCTQLLAKHGITVAQSNKIFHALYREWGMILLPGRLAEFIEIFTQMYNPETHDEIVLTQQIMKEFEAVKKSEKESELHESVMKDRIEKQITTIKCIEESGEISSNKAEALIKRCEHLNAWESAEDKRASP